MSKYLGVVEVGALADLLLVNGDPIADIGLLADPGKNLTVIMIDGQIVKKLAGGEVSFLKGKERQIDDKVASLLIG